MNLVNCKNLRTVIVSAAFLLALGFILQAPRLLFGADYPMLTTLLSGIGLVALAVSPLVVVLAGLATLVPAVSRRLELCQH